MQRAVLKATTGAPEIACAASNGECGSAQEVFFANPCAGVEFPAGVDGLFRPHYVTWSEQQKIELSGPEYLRHVIRMVTETGLPMYKELAPMKKDQLDLENRVDSGLEDLAWCCRGAIGGNRY